MLDFVACDIEEDKNILCIILFKKDFIEALRNLSFRINELRMLKPSKGATKLFLSKHNYVTINLSNKQLEDYELPSYVMSKTAEMFYIIL